MNGLKGLSRLPQKRWLLKPQRSRERLGAIRIAQLYSSTSAEGNVKEKVPDLKRFIRDKIRASGPLTIAEYMQLCLSTPQVGYYTGRREGMDIFGEKGDFVTSPELSQMFGEVLAAWILNELQCMGMGADQRIPWQIIELGPGRGLMISDIIRVLNRFKATGNLTLRLVEMSENLAVLQERNLRQGDGAKRIEFNKTDDTLPWYQRSLSFTQNPIYWYQSLADIPKKFSVILAHEFFDALPVHCFQRNQEGQWRELCVDLQSLENDSGLQFALSPSETPSTRLLIPPEIRNDLKIKEYEACPQAIETMNLISKIIVENGGVFLAIDYGHSGEKGLTLRAFKNHKSVDPLSTPGEIDLTADVNFKNLARAASDQMRVFGPVTQGEFLERLGIKLRLQSLVSKAKNEKDKDYLQKCVDYMTSPEQMGERFKVLSAFPKTLDEIFRIREAPAGFADAKK